MYTPGVPAGAPRRRKGSWEVGKRMKRSLDSLNKPWAAALALLLLICTAYFFFVGRAEVPEAAAYDAPPPEAADGVVDAGATDGPDAEDGRGPEEEASPEGGNGEAAYGDELGPFSPQRPGVEARIEECVVAEDQEACVKDLVADVAPGAKYIGARTELNTDGSGRNQKVIYYEDPALESCEFTKKAFDSGADTTYHSVIIAGLGAFSDKKSEGCVIEF